MPQAYRHRQAEMYWNVQQSSRTNGDRFQNWIVKDWFIDWLLSPECCNHHNNVYWGGDRPEEIDEWCLKGPKVTALCERKEREPWAILAWGQQRKNCHVNGERYSEVLNRINKDLDQLYTPNQKIVLWFQQDGATAHTTQSTMAHLHTLLGNRV